MPRLAVFFIIFVLLLSACAPAQAEMVVQPNETASSIPASATPPPAIASPIPDPQSDIPTPEGHFLLPGELVLAASPDDIPAIMASPEIFVDAEKGDEEWAGEEEVIGVFINGEARAYPIRLLSLHEVVNDTVGGQAILVTWCPLCYSSLVFDRNVDRELTFGVSGYLFNNNLVMYDHQSNTLWSQLLAQGLRGAYGGQRLDLIPAVQTSWDAWKSEHPDTLVLSAVQMGRNPDEIFDPYAGYYNSAAAGFGGQGAADSRLPAKDLVLGLVVGDQQKAFPFHTLQSLELVEDEVNSLPVLLVYNRALNSVEIYDRRVSGQTLSFEFGPAENTLIDTQTGSTWALDTGESLSGDLAGNTLRKLVAPIVFWFAWSDIHPETELYID